MILMSSSGSLEALVERLLARVRELESVMVQQKRVFATEPVGPQTRQAVGVGVAKCGR
jgi:hypothetical protein